MHKFNLDDINMFNGDSISLYDEWNSPVVIMVDGPYGINGYKGDLHTYKGLAEWYEPHIKIWAERASYNTTLWFWNTEVGWATVHPVLEEYGWEYKCCHIWDKGKSHVAGNVNTKTISHLPVVSEVCVQYTKTPKFSNGTSEISMQAWMISEWKRTKLPFRLTNEACGVKAAATRKYFTSDNLWYMPPTDAFEQIVHYANLYGDEKGKPYFSINGKIPITAKEWDTYKPKFYCEFGKTNVWNLPQLRGAERLKQGTKSIHLNQKPLEIIEMLIRMSSDINDTVWDPFAGLATTALACYNLNRKCFCSEISKDIFDVAKTRLLQNAQKLF